MLPQACWDLHLTWCQNHWADKPHLQLQHFQKHLSYIWATSQACYWWVHLIYGRLQYPMPVVNWLENFSPGKTVGWHQASGYQFGGQRFRSEHGNDELLVQLVTSLSTLSSSFQEQSFCVLFPGARKWLETCRPTTWRAWWGYWQGPAHKCHEIGKCSMGTTSITTFTIGATISDITQSQLF